jgi:ring-1,2-phenylacetyl-CoA epoxidase subunit PaaC
VRAGDYAVWLGDDALIRAQRLCWWLTRAPELEEEVALANIALDLLGQARSLLSHGGADEDALAFRRSPEEYRCVHLVERADGEFGTGIARQLAFSAYQQAQWAALLDCADETIAAVAGKAIKEVAYHLDHAVAWTLRLGDGTDVSHARMQAGLDAVWPDLPELFAAAPELADLVATGVAVDPRTLARAFAATVQPVLREAGLALPTVPAAAGGGRRGVRTPEFAALHEELTQLHLAHPGASW